MMCFSKINKNCNYDCLFHSPYISFSPSLQQLSCVTMLGIQRNKRRRRPHQDAEHYIACKIDKPGLQEHFISKYKGKIFQYLQLKKLPIILICKTEKIMCNVYLWFLNTVLHEWVLKHRNKCMFALLIPSSQSQWVFEGAQDISPFIPQHIIHK